MSVQDGKPCPFCGLQHEPGPVVPAFGGVPLNICESVPPGTVYIDAEFAVGPPGILALLDPDA